MKQLNLYKTAMCCFFLFFFSTTTFSQNLIVNPSFEFGTRGVGQSAFPNGDVDDWSEGYVVGQQPQGGSADIIDNDPSSNWKYGPLPNYWFDLGGIQPHEGDRYVRFFGGVDDPTPPFPTQINQESIMGRFTGPICAGTYNLSFWATTSLMARPSQTSPLQQLYPSVHPENKVEVVLRKNGSPGVELVVYTSTQLQVGSWVQYSVTISITQSQALNEFDRIEFRCSDDGVPGSQNLCKEVFLDDLSLTNSGTIANTISSSSAMYCTQTSVNLNNQVQCDGTLSGWFDNVTFEPKGPQVKPTTATTYTAICTNDYGCETWINHTVYPANAEESVENVEICWDNNNYVIDLSSMPDCSIDPMTNVTVNSYCNYSINPTDGSSYIVRWKDANGNCFKKTYNFTRLNVNNDTDPIDIVVCEGDNYILDGSYCNSQGANSYTISQGGAVWATNSPVVVIAGSYDETWSINCYKNGCYIGSKTVNVDSEPTNKVDYGLDPTPVLLCDDEIFNPQKCSIPAGATVTWVDEDDNVLSSEPTTGGLNEQYSTPNGPKTYQKIVSGPGRCEECKESYDLQWGVNAADEFPAVILGNYSGVIPCGNGIISYYYTRCQGEFGIDLNSILPAKNTIFDFPSNCGWYRMVNNETPEEPGNVHYDNSTGALTGLRYDPATGFLYLNPSVINLSNYPVGGPCYQDGNSNNTYPTYQVTFCYKCTGNSGCEAEEVCFRIAIREMPCKRGFVSTDDISELNTEVTIYPNPSNGVFTLSLAGYQLDKVSYTITDAVGKEVYNSSNVTSEQTEINLSHLSEGVYFLRLRYREAIITKKIIIQ